VTERRGRRHKQLLYDFQEKKGYCNLKEEALDRTVETSFWKSIHLSYDRQQNDDEGYFSGVKEARA
jgi:hypothetical protein